MGMTFTAKILNGFNNFFKTTSFLIIFSRNENDNSKQLKECEGNQAKGEAEEVFTSVSIIV